ncbi:MAG: TonB-dependent receptor, partial [Bacteroidota bacterium]
MKYIAIFLLGLLLHAGLQAQIHGQLQDEDGRAVAFASVQLLQASDSSRLMAVLSDEQGLFQISTSASDSLLLLVQATSFQRWYSPVFVIAASQNAYPVGTIVLQEQSYVLEEVQIEAQHRLIQQTVEGYVVRIEDSPMANGGSALQVLERAPGMFVDQQNQQLMLNGQTGLMIQINGRLMRMSQAQLIQFLQGISAAEIEKIEFLTQPSARHDSDGAAGIINIVLKRNTIQGTNGSLAINAGHGWGEKYGLNGSLNHRQGAWSFNTSYAFNHDDSFSNFFGGGTQSVPILGGPMDIYFDQKAERSLDVHSLNLGFET